MCGISVILKRTENEIFVKDCLSHASFKRRGPDIQQQVCLDTSDGIQIIFDSSILHLRGQLTAQPVSDSDGNTLLWNGEIFGGLHVEDDENDTAVLSRWLQTCASKQSVVDVMSRIEGPWSFIYWQNHSRRLWFGRDVFGRRSLLWHLPTDDTSDAFVLSSVRLPPLAFQEVPCHGIYCLSFDSMCFPSQVELIAWSHLSRAAIHDSLGHLLQGHSCMTVHIDPGDVLRHKLPILDVTQPLPEYSITPLDTADHLKYLRQLLQIHGELKSAANALLRCLQDAVTVRVSSIPRGECMEEAKSPECGGRCHLGDVNDDEETAYSNETVRRYTGVTVSGIPQIESVAKEARSPESRCRCHQSDDNDVGVTANESCRSHRGCNCNSLNTSSDILHHTLNDKCPAHVPEKTDSDKTRSCDGRCNSQSFDGLEEVQGFVRGPFHMPQSARVAVLFSGGIDSAVIAALAHRCVPLAEPIDLLNVAFEERSKGRPCDKETKKAHQDAADVFAVPDRLTGLRCIADLSPRRKWNFVEVNVTLSQLQTFREERVKDLIYPLNTVLDDSIGCALWFAARGQGLVLTDSGVKVPFVSSAKVVLVGMGADEQLGGYSRHRSAFINDGWPGLLREIDSELARISHRNLGRDDRIISDHGRESRYPFLDERVVSLLNSTPIHLKCDPSLPRGVGEKLLLRLVAVELGLMYAAVLPKRAIQFGSRIAKLENAKEKATDSCSRLK